MDSHERSDSHSVTGTGYFVNSNAPTSSFIHAMTSCNGINHPRNRIHVRKPFNVESVYVFGKKKKTNLNSVLFFSYTEPLYSSLDRVTWRNRMFVVQQIVCPALCHRH